jgi:hypothetical protein
MAAANYSSTFAMRWRAALRSVGIGIAPAATTADASVPTITSGSGAPSATVADGSLYLRTDGTDGDDSLYMRISGSWVALKCQTA